MPEEPKKEVKHYSMTLRDKVSISDDVISTLIAQDEELDDEIQELKTERKKKVEDVKNQVNEILNS